MSTARLETFADGVFAIAATLLIIDVNVDAHGDALGGALTHSWPQYAAYAVSFLTIGVMWVNHHACLDQIARADRRFLFANLGLLACIAFVPFPTRLVAEHLRDGGLRAAAITYGVTMTATAISFGAVWFYAAAGRRLIAPDADDRVVAGISRSYLPGTPIYGLSTLVALWSPTASVALFAAIAVFYALESSLFGGGRSPETRRYDA
jgi:TMEM175 potassium channel family protein